MTDLASLGWSLFGAALLCCSASLAAPVSGTVREQGTGSRLEGITVQVQHGPSFLTRADGSFEIDLDPGTWTLTAEGVDHIPHTLTLNLPTDTPITIFLHPVDGAHDIVVESFRPTAHVSRHIVDAEMAFETPGTHDDAVRLVQALPGVMVQREYSPNAGDLSVRASKPGDNRYFLDGVQVPYLYHFNQYASVFPTGQIDTLNLYSSTFGVPFGDSVGAIIDASSRVDPPDGVHGNLTFNTIMVGGDIRLPLGQRWWGAGSARRSYHDIAANSNAQYLVWPQFSDYSLRLEHGDADKGTGVFLLGASDSYVRAAGELDLLDPLEADQTPSFNFHRNFQIVGLRHRFQTTAIQGRLVAATTLESLSGHLDGVGSQEQRSRVFTARADLNGPLPDSMEWYGGLEIRQEQLNLVVTGAGPQGLLVANEAPALARGADVDTRSQRLRWGGYGQLRLNAGALRVFPGVRMTSDSTTGTFSLSPRATLRWQAAQQTAFKIAGGHYVQHPQSDLLLAKTGNPQLLSTKSWQIAAGVEQTIQSRLELTAEVYHKWLIDPVLVQPDGPPDNEVGGRISGIEAVMRYRLRDRFFLWGWAGWSRSRMRTASDAILIGDFDQPLSGGLVASWDPNRHLHIALRYRIGSGLPTTPIDEGLFNAEMDRYEPIPGLRNSTRMPLYQKVDAAIGYTFIFPRWALTLHLELWYVPKSSAQLYPTWSYDYTEQAWVEGIPVLPLLGARAKF